MTRPRNPLNAYARRLLVQLGEAETTPLAECEADALQRLGELDMVEVRGQQVALTWEGIVKLRELRP
jgi:hypothetical protein